MKTKVKTKDTAQTWRDTLDSLGIAPVEDTTPITPMKTTNAPVTTRKGAFVDAFDQLVKRNQKVTP